MLRRFFNALFLSDWYNPVGIFFNVIVVVIINLQVVPFQFDYNIFF